MRYLDAVLFIIGGTALAFWAYKIPEHAHVAVILAGAGGMYVGARVGVRLTLEKVRRSPG